MAAPPKLKRLSLEDYSGMTPEVRKGIEKLLTSLNPFLTDVTGGLDHGLTVADNLRCVVRRDIVVTTEATNPGYGGGGGSVGPAGPAGPAGPPGPAGGGGKMQITYAFGAAWGDATGGFLRPFDGSVKADGAEVQLTVPAAGTLRLLSYDGYDKSGALYNATYTLRINKVDTPLSVTTSGTAAAEVTNAATSIIGPTATVPVAAGNRISVRADMGGTVIAAPRVLVLFTEA